MLPQGYLASGDGYTYRHYEAVEDLPDKKQCVDDSCQYSKEEEECFWKTCNYLQRCGEKGIILNPKKFQYCQD